MTHTTRTGLGVRVRRALHVWVVALTALVLSAPIWLGPAAPWALRELGASDDHHCACGMQKGKCGCLECAAAEAEAKLAKKHSPVPIVKSSCSSDEDVPFFAALPVVALPSQTLIPASAVARMPIDASHYADPSRERGPPTPPPPKRVVSNLPV